MACQAKRKYCLAVKMQLKCGAAGRAAQLDLAYITSWMCQRRHHAQKMCRAAVTQKEWVKLQALGRFQSKIRSSRRLSTMLNHQPSFTTTRHTELLMSCGHLLLL